ncbi:hypothetical protein [Rhizobium esperanzae]|uniref:hypothetical protein n=1 Tax=Rhizobium esperanzae TaxID=1967781 RepID=UPI001FD8CC09|nr:hypothetical protein [Rhizobium esperanzae]
MRLDSFRTLVDSKILGPVFVSSGKLPFEDWRLVTVIPRATFAGDIDANTERVMFIIGAIALLAAVTSILFARHSSLDRYPALPGNAPDRGVRTRGR